MTTRSEIDALSALSRQFSDALATLDGLGRHVAAAHLVAAIDAIDRDITGLSIGAAPDDAERAADAFAAQMIATFGDRTEAVVRRQLIGAGPAVRQVWATVLDRVIALSRTTA